ncbi:MAG: hypothetical protein GY954_08865 [Alteromonas sp.]|nr:hypothetical protein [Alteromonas sp.]
MSDEFISTAEKNGDIVENGFIICKREDGNYAVPGGFHVTCEAYARQIAKRLAYELKARPAKLAAKTVTRIRGASSSTAVMGV